MISGNIEKFNTPVRSIEAKAELVAGAAFATQEGTALYIDNAVDYAAPMDIQLESKNLFPIGSFSFELNKHVVFDTPLPANTPMTLSGIVESSNTEAPYMLIMAITESGSCIAYSQFPFNTGKRESLTLKYTEPIVKYTFYAGTGWANAEGQTANYTEFQVELGSIATDYMPYDDLSGITVYRTGKNLFPTGNFDFTVNKGFVLDIPIPANTPLVFSAIGESTATNSTWMLIQAMYTDGTYATGGSAIGFPIGATGRQVFKMTYPKPVAKINFYSSSSWTNANNEKSTAKYTDFQIELGTEATEYTPYMGMQAATADKSGKVEGLTSLKPMTLSTDTGAIITATYEIPPAENKTFTANDVLQSIIIDRVGESKFFGYGISQKATLKVIDKERTTDPQKNDKLNITFDNTCVLPFFYVKETKRDENTNNLTITAFDVIESAAKHTYAELGLAAYSLADLAAACANLIGATGTVIGDGAEWAADYSESANFDGTETIREVLNDIAEVTQTIYFINQENKLVFKALDITGAAVYEIDKSKYFSLTSEDPKTLTTVATITDLGDNVEATDGNGEKQYIRNNAFWALRDDVGALIEDALAQVGGLTIAPYECLWRGNYLLELGDKIALTAKDGSTIASYLLNDTITYNGGYSQKSNWKLEDTNETHTNPSTLGEALAQTFAKVDKANKQIELVVSKEEATSKQVSSLTQTVSGISASVTNIEQSEKSINENIETLTNRVNAIMTDEEIKVEIQKEIANGVSTVRTGKGFTFDDSGLTIEDINPNSNKQITTTVSNNGMQVFTDGDAVLTANDSGVQAVDLHATTYLIIGKNSRLEDKGSSRTYCFWIGG